MTSWERFQKLNSTVHTTNQEVVNSHFIFKGYPSIKITGPEGEEIQAAVVNKQEQDYGYIYTYLKDPLAIGSIWQAKDLHLLVDEEIVIIKDVNWHKYHCLLCNLEYEGLWGYFIGPEKTHINLNLKKDVVLVSQQKPLLVLPGMPLHFQDKIMIKGRAWVVDEYDAISDEGITYYSLMPTTMSKEIIKANEDKTVFIEEHVEPELELIQDSPSTSAVEIAPNSKITVTTEDGYFKISNKAAKILKYTSTEIVFQPPFGVEEVTIQYKQNGQVLERIYKIGY